MKHKTRTEHYEESFTVDGKTHTIPKTREVKVPAVPRDFDATVLSTVTRVTCLVVVAAMVWSTVSIGSMLSQVAPTWTAYMIAGVFDLAWISALAVEWLSRYQPNKAKFPKAVGWAALAVSIAAIFAHGLLAHQPVAGAVGAVISALAKVMWMLVMRHTAKALTPDQQAWVDAEMSEANALLAVTVARRQVARVRARAADELAALEFGRADYQVSQAPPTPAESAEAADETEREQNPVPVLRSVGENSVPEPSSAEVPVAEPGAAPVPVVAVPSGRNFGSDIGSRTELLNNLINGGVTDLAELRNQVRDAGFTAPSDSYIRRLVRGVAK
ncbi:hypothetical protein [Actinacidiphila rubida]|uniref:Protein transporter Sec31 n=1 Tax=Actinacidiphila rubida TaxID=310780 RepID=A0A1H8LAA8_9ACTN|nr:hypothetical protein [Actinacidiphila rubida]SEO01658.1 hypothetical protein SAMN05216267_1015111 [Actinacidiphila rubida]